MTKGQDLQSIFSKDKQQTASFFNCTIFPPPTFGYFDILRSLGIECYNSLNNGYLRKSDKNPGLSRAK